MRYLTILLQGLGMKIVPATEPAMRYLYHFASGSGHGDCSCDRVCFSR